MGSKTWWIIVGALLVAFACDSFYTNNEIQRLSTYNTALAEQNSKLKDILSKVFQEKFDLARLKIDEVTVSSYSSDYNQCDSEPYITSTGSTVSPGCVALSRDLPITKNKHILAVGLGTFRNEDTMHKRHSKALDVWLPDKKAAKAFGIRKNVSIMWLE